VCALVAAAAAFFVLRSPPPTRSAPIAIVEDDEIVLVLGAERIGDRIVTHDGHATITSKNGTRVAVDAHGDVDLERTPTLRKLALHSGALEAHVTKLAAGNRFVVTTEDAEVEVRGTAFRVAVSDAAACGTRTSVSVSEGTVWVRHHGKESVVEAGAVWPKCEAVVPVPVPLRVPMPAPTVTHSISTATETTISPSVLAEQNRIFEEAIAAKRRGDVETAVWTFERVTQGPLAESAAAERFRVLSSAKDSRAAAAARDYLARYPKGFAAGEARALVP
jgi:hypothetical protein